MIALPITIGIVMLGLLLLQHNHYLFIKQQQSMNKVIADSGEIDKLRKEFTEYKKRVDSLTLKAGFKL